MPSFVVSYSVACIVSSQSGSVSGSGDQRSRMLESHGTACCAAIRAASAVWYSRPEWPRPKTVDCMLKLGLIVRHQILVPPADRRLDLFHDINPEPGRVKKAEPTLAERLVPKRKGDRGVAAHEAFVLHPGIRNLELQTHPLTAEWLGSWWSRRVRRMHESKTCLPAGASAD